MDEIISDKMCAVKVRNAKLRNYLKFWRICMNWLDVKCWLNFLKHFLQILQNFDSVSQP